MPPPRSPSTPPRHNPPRRAAERSFAAWPGSDVKDNIHVSFSAMTVVHGWWIEPGTTGVVVDSSGDGDVAIKLTTGKYAGEIVKVGARYIDEVGRPRSRREAAGQATEEREGRPGSG